MQLYPAIHIKRGKCFNPRDNKMGMGNIFTNNPVKLAKIWESCGASYIHIVDVDGATLGYPVHEELIKEIIETVSIPVQVGGGLRTIKDIDNFLCMGAQRVVCGTQAVESQKFVVEAIQLFGPERFVVGIDAKNSMIVTQGREKMSNHNTVSFGKMLKDAGVKTVVYTDILRSTMHKGPSLENTKDLIEKTNLEVIISGGITRYRELDEIKQLKASGAVLASAIYNGSVDLKEAVPLYEKLDEL